MTRLMFDIWFRQELAAQVEHVSLIRSAQYRLYADSILLVQATIVLTIVGISVFVGRLPGDLNIDFVGGTAYGGELEEPLNIAQLRNCSMKAPRKSAYKSTMSFEDKVAGKEGLIFDITYKNEDGSQETRLSNSRTAQEH